jgi:hypothetical protein
MSSDISNPGSSAAPAFAIARGGINSLSARHPHGLSPRHALWPLKRTPLCRFILLAALGGAVIGAHKVTHNKNLWRNVCFAN